VEGEPQAGYGQFTFDPPSPQKSLWAPIAAHLALKSSFLRSFQINARVDIGYGRFNATVEQVIKR
jgi:hypothetical protein